MSRPEYLKFVEISPDPRIITVYSIKTPQSLGLIEWDSRWEQFVFRHSPDSQIDERCQQAIIRYLEVLNLQLDS